MTLIGAGKMGVKIAARAAIFGFKVRVYDVSMDMLKKARDLIRSDIQATCDEGVSKEDPKVKDIDRAWKVWSGMIAGPFGMMDFVGLDVVYDIEMSYYLDSNDPTDKPPEALRRMVERGELGRKSGKGFYDWSDPEFIKPEFTQPGKKT